MDPDRSHDAVDTALNEAKGMPVPQVALKYKSRKLRLLVALCKVLAENSGGEWFLSCRKAAELLETDPMTANSWLRKLVADRILEYADSHKPGSLKAQRYRYIGDLLDDSWTAAAA
jgi:hypothetical protein